MLQVVRSPDGRVVSGTLGPNGRAGSPRRQMQRLIDCQLEEAMRKRNSAAEFVEDACAALENPTENIAFTTLVLNRVWPAVDEHELRLVEPEAQGSSQALLDGLAADFGSQLPEDARLVGTGVPIESEPTRGAD